MPAQKVEDAIVMILGSSRHHQNLVRIFSRKKCEMNFASQFSELASARTTLAKMHL